MFLQNKKTITSLFLVLTLLAVIPININVPTDFITELNSSQEIYGSQNRPNYVIVPITVNKVEGTALTNEQVEANLKRMNEIYNCEVVIFVWDGKINEIEDPDEIDDGNIDDDVADRTAVRNAASANADGKGVSITVANSLGDANTNGITTVGGAHSALVKSGTDGTTWAHEIQHALGQTHGPARPADEDINGDAPGNGEGWDVNGDGKVTNADKGYNLWGRRSDRTGNTINYDMIDKAATALAGARPKTRPAPIFSGNGQNTTRTGVINDTRGDQANQTKQLKPTETYIDVINGGITKDYTLQGNIQMFAQIAASPINNCSYYFAIDNLPASGDNRSRDFDGADLLIQFTLDVGNPLTYSYRWNNTGAWMPLEPLPPFETQSLTDTVSYDNDTGSGQIESFFDVFLTVDISSLPIINEIEGVFTAWIVTNWSNPTGIEYISDISDKNEIVLQNNPLETIGVNNDTVKAGGTLLVNGTKFTPNSNVTIYLDGVNITTVKADAKGGFFANITIPAGPGKSSVILMARNTAGKTDAMYINIQGISQGGLDIILIVLIIAGVAVAILIAIWFIKKRGEN